MSARVVAVMARKEVADALANRWFLLYACVFLVLALAFAQLSLGVAAGHTGFGRTVASLVNLVLLIVPLMGLTLGAASLAAERESGTLATLLAQPVLPREVALGKFLGLATALTGALALGFGAAGALIARGGGAVDATTLAGVVGAAALLGYAMLAVGLFISAVSQRTATAAGAALVAWLGLVFLSDLGLMGGAVLLRMSVDTLLALVIANPVGSFKVMAVAAITGNVDVLGPAGVYATRAYGDWLPVVLTGALVAWIIVPLMGTMAVLERRLAS